MTAPSLTEDLADLRRIIREKQVDEAVREVASRPPYLDYSGCDCAARAVRKVWRRHRAQEAGAGAQFAQSVSRFAPSSDAGKRDMAHVSDAARTLSRCPRTPSSVQRATTEALRAELAARGRL